MSVPMCFARLGLSDKFCKSIDYERIYETRAERPGALTRDAKS